MLKQIAGEWVGEDGGGGLDVNGREVMMAMEKLRGDAEVRFDDRHRVPKFHP